MTDAGAVTIGGLLVLSAWGGGWLLGQLARAMADELAVFIGRHGPARQGGAGQHGADADAPGAALIRIEAGTRALWLVDVHGEAVESETIGLASGKSAARTDGGRA